MSVLALLSDIHGNLPALQQVVADLQRRRVRRVFNLGDHLSGPLWPKETARFLMADDWVTQSWVHIQGNHDRQLVTQDPAGHGPSDRYAYQQLSEIELNWLRSLPPTLEVAGEFYLFHASPSSDTTYLLETVERGRTRLATPSEIENRLGGARAPLLLCGHTHTPRLVQLPDRTLIVNPGSVGLPAYDDLHPEYHVVETGSPHARYALLEKRNGAWQVELVAVEYDHHLSADRARQNGRPDWEVGLRTGFMNNTANPG
jgi:predicted phosphodiesterase